MQFRHIYRILVISILSVTGIGIGKAKTVAVTPGSLATILGAEAETTITLTLTGSVNATDLMTLSQMKSLRQLDMSGVTIESMSAESPVHLGHRRFDANVIPDYMFFTSRLTSIVLPATLTEIGEGAFAASAIKEVTMGNGMKTIGAWAFMNCADLTSVQLPASVTSLGKGVFKQCTSLKEINLAATALTILPDEAFMGCTALSSFAFPTGLETIGEYCFTATALAEIAISPKVKSIGAYSLSNMPALKSADLGNSANLGEGVLSYNSALTTLTDIPGNLPPMALAGSPQLVLDTTLTKAFTHIGDMALADNPTATYVFSENLMYVGERVLDGADNLHSIFVYYLKGNIPQTSDSAFYGIKNPESRDLWVDKDYATAWETDPQWSMFTIHRATLSVEENLLPADQAITFEMDGATLVITAASPLTDVLITDLNGILVAALRPQALSARVDLTDRQGGVLIVKASTAATTRTSKLTIRR